MELVRGVLPVLAVCVACGIEGERTAGGLAAPPGPMLQIQIMSPDPATVVELAQLLIPVTGRDRRSDSTPLTLSWAMVPVPPSGPVTGTVSGTGMVSVTFSWTPGCNDSSAGPYQLTFTLSGGGESIDRSVGVIVQPVDCPPEVVAPATARFKVGHPGSFTVSASDPDGDPVTLTLQSMTPTPQVAPSFVLGKLSWTPGAGDQRPYIATFRATAGSLFDTADTAISVDLNAPPVIVAPASAGFSEGTAGSFAVSATDADGDPVTLTLVSVVPAPQVAPAFAAGTFSWTPGFLDAGVRIATFRATDGIDAVTATVSLSVANANRSPSVAIAPPGDAKTVAEAQPIAFTATVSDPDTDDTLSISASGVPTGAAVTVAGTVATFSWTPGFDQGTVAGRAYPVTFTGQDGRGGSLARTVTITVINTNRPPAFSAVAPQTIAEGSLLTFTLSATDPDGDALAYSALALPTGAGFDPATRSFSWAPSCTAADAGGGYQARFQVTDGQAPATLTVAITVTGEAVRVTPSPIDFPAVRVGESATPVTVTIANVSASAPFTVDRIATTSSVFPTTSGTLPATVPAGGSIAATVGFVPAASAGYLDTLTVMTRASTCAATTATVTGIGQTPGLQVSRGGADFGSVRVGATSAPVAFTVTNVGDAPFTVSSVTLSNGQDFALTLVSPTSYPATVAPAGTISFTVAGRPMTAGLKTGSVVVATDIPGAGPTTLSLQLVGVAPGLRPSLAMVDFGPTDVRGEGESRTLSVTNDGTDTLTVTAAEIAGADAARFDIATGPPTPFTVPPLATASFVLVYRPVAENAGESAALRIASDAAGEMLAEIPLSGRGVDRHLQLAATRLEFGNTFRGRAVDRTLTIGNSGGAPLAFQLPFAITGDGAAAFSVPEAPPAEVPPFDEAEIRVRFLPPAAGTFIASLEVRSDDGATPLAAVTLAGNATLSPLVVSPVTLAADQVPVGTTRRLRQKVNVANVSDSEAVSIARVCGGAGNACEESIFRAEPGGERILSPGDAFEVAVDFTPREARVYDGRILVFVAGAAEPQYFVAVSGEGIEGLEVHGGGCHTGAGGGVAGIVVVLALLLGRRGLCVLLFASTAWGQKDTSFDLRAFRPRNAGPGSFVTVEQPGVLPANAFGVGAFVSYARNPLVAERGGMTTAAVSDRTELTLLVSYGLFGRAEASLVLPMVVQSGTTGAGVIGGSGTELGDVGLGARVAILRSARFGLSLSAELTLPTGDDEQYAGAGAVTGGASLVAGLAVGRARFGATAGARFRGRTAELAGTRQGAEVALGLAAGLGVTRALEAIGELYGAIGLEDKPVSPFEGIIGLRWWPAATLALTGGGGAGLHDGIGASDVRLFLGVTYVPGARATELSAAAEPRPAAPVVPPVAVPAAPPLDSDADGAPDAADRCPGEAEDIDTFQDDDGCFDPDNDGDGIFDVLDLCVMEAETINGNEDGDGCPDAGDGAVVVRSDRLELVKPVPFRGERLATSAQGVLLQVAATLRAHPEILRIRIVTFVARRGSPPADYQRSAQRGEAVRKFLRGKGIEPERLDVKPMGSVEATGNAKQDDRIELWIGERR